MKHIKHAIVFLLFFLASVVGQPPLGANADAEVVDAIREAQRPFMEVVRLGQMAAVAASAVGVAYYATLPYTGTYPPPHPAHEPPRAAPSARRP